MKLLVLSTLVAAASAACSNQCSGHGVCDQTDSCKCSPRWVGPDCSKRECPKGKSWVWSGSAETKGAGMGAIGGSHAYTECSSKGTCDAETGECQCYQGYEGRACARQSCPGGCSGHGRCVYNSKVATKTAKFENQHWDADMTRQCSCDRGWTGYACEKRMCPRGNDPLRCATDAEKKDQMSIQVVDVLLPTKVDDTNDLSMATVNFETHITLTFEDMFNGKFTTKPILINGASPAATAVEGKAWKTTEQFKAGEEDDFDANRIRAALQALPNFAIPRVNVTNYKYESSAWAYAKCPDGASTSDGSAATAAGTACPNDADHKSGLGWSFAVTFSHAATSGPQTKMTCAVASAATDFAAVAPRMQKPRCPVAATETACVWDSNTCKVTATDVLVPLSGGGDVCSTDSTLTTEALCIAKNYKKATLPESACVFTSKKFGCEWDASESDCNQPTNAEAEALFSAGTTVTGTCSSHGTEKLCHSNTYTVSDQGTCHVATTHDYIGGEQCGDKTTAAACTAANYNYVMKDCAVKCNVRSSSRLETEGDTAAGAALKGTECSERGLCDAQTGLCACFDGYAGEACSQQTVFF